MLLIPEESMIQEISQIISTSGILKQFDWAFFKRKLPEEIYKQLINATLEQEYQFSHSY